MHPIDKIITCLDMQFTKTLHGLLHRNRGGVTIILMLFLFPGILPGQSSENIAGNDSACITWLGNIRVDQCRQQFSFPAQLNQSTGLIEVILCTPSGKTHESLFVSKIDPLLFEAALTLIGAFPSKAYVNYRSEPEKIKKRRPPKKKPDLLEIWVCFTDSLGKKTERIESFILNRQSGQTLQPSLWHFKGIPADEAGIPYQYMGNNLVVSFLDMDSILEVHSSLLFDDQYLFANEDKTKPIGNKEVSILVTLKK